MTRRLRCTLAATALATGLWSGCGQPTTTATTGETRTAATKADSTPGATPAPQVSGVALNVVSTAEFEAAIRQHRGRVVLVDAWFLG